MLRRHRPTFNHAVRMCISWPSAAATNVAVARVVERCCGMGTCRATIDGKHLRRCSRRSGGESAGGTCPRVSTEDRVDMVMEMKMDMNIERVRFTYI